MVKVDRSWILLLLALVMVVNLGLSWYIFVQKTNNDERHAIFPDNCFTDTPGGGGCFTVQTSPYATTLGIANPVYGMFFFSMLTILLSLLWLSVWEHKPGKYMALFRSHFKATVLLIMLAGSVFSLWLLYVQYIILKTTCIYCLWVDGIMIGSTIIFALVIARHEIVEMYERVLDFLAT